MPKLLPLYAQLQTQLNRYSPSPIDSTAISDLLVTVAMHLADDHPQAARNLMVEAEVAQHADRDLLV